MQTLIKHPQFKITDTKQNNNLLKKCTKNQFNIFNAKNVYSLHDPYDLNHIHGLRKY